MNAPERIFLPDIQASAEQHRQFVNTEQVGDCRCSG